MSQLKEIPREGSTVFASHSKGNYPQLNKKVFIVGNCFRAGAIAMFARAGCTAASSIDDADLVVFLGGEDVDPALYGERALGGTYFNVRRDSEEIDVFTECMAASVPMFGICRGMQFLHVMNGGKLWQDVRNHTRPHNIKVVDTGEIIAASSMHHQMVIEDATTFVLAYAENPGHGETYQSYGREVSSSICLDVEAAVYPNINAIAVQGHPEVDGTPEFTAWTLTQIGEFLDELDGIERAVGGDSLRELISRAIHDV